MVVRSRFAEHRLDVPEATESADDCLRALDAIYDEVLGSTDTGVGAGDRSLAACIERHRRRAGRLAQELSRLRASEQALTAGLNAIGFPVFVAGADRRLLHLNASATALRDAESIIAVQDGGLVATHQAANAALQRAIGSALDGRGAPDGVHVLLGPRPSPRGAIVLPTTFGDVAAAIVLVGDPTGQIERGVDAVARIDGLTAAERRLLGAIVDGEGLVAAAARLGISTSTARTHLKRIFAKTQTERQIELMRVVATLAPPVARRSRPGAADARRHL